MVKRKVLFVQYLDHALFSREELDKGPIQVVTVGMLADEDENALFLDLNLWETGDSDTMVILKPTIQKIEELGEVVVGFDS